MSTPVGIPARLSSATASMRFRGCGVWGSLARQGFGSSDGIDRFAEVGICLNNSMSLSNSGDFVNTERASRVTQCLPDPRHQLVFVLHPLIRVGVGADGDVLVRPPRPQELDARELRRVDLHDDLALEVPAGVEVEVGVGRPGEAADACMAQPLYGLMVQRNGIRDAPARD